MKTIIRIKVIFIAICLSIAMVSEKATAQHAYVSFQVFYDQLSPYGHWVAYPHYGYVWIPNAGHDFVPYSTNGYWINTDYGWTWASDYPWGWAPFHYGRWDYDNYYGWFWVPDEEWAPAWVVWRQSPGYFGWTPLKPGISINVVFGRGYDIPHDRWIFVREKDFGRQDIEHYRVNRSNNFGIIHNSTIINDTYIDNNRRRSSYFSGPDRREVQRATGNTVKRISVNEIDRPEQRINNDHIQIYKPQIHKSDESGQNRYSPKPVEKWNRQKSLKEHDKFYQKQEMNRSKNYNKKSPQVNNNPSNNEEDKQQTNHNRR